MENVEIRLKFISLEPKKDVLKYESINKND